MTRDPIVEEIHAIRNEHAARFNYDLTSIVRDLIERQDPTRYTYVSLPPKQPEEPAVPSGQDR